jgi:hypothetical protein
MIAADVIVTNSSWGIVGDGSPAGWAGVGVIGGEASFTGASALGT